MLSYRDYHELCEVTIVALIRDKAVDVLVLVSVTYLIQLVVGLSHDYSHVLQWYVTG